MVTILPFILIMAVGFYLVYRVFQEESARHERDQAQSESQSIPPLARLRKSSGEAAPAPKPLKPLVIFENATCEVCSAAPLVRYRRGSLGSILEFCGHHAKKHGPPLESVGYRVVLDGRE